MKDEFFPIASVPTCIGKIWRQCMRFCIETRSHLFDVMKNGLHRFFVRCDVVSISNNDVNDFRRQVDHGNMYKLVILICIRIYNVKEGDILDG